MDKINHHRRRVLSVSIAALGLSLLPSTLLAAQKNNRSQSRTLYIKAINLNETLRSTYFDGQDYVPEELTKLKRLFRDRRSDEEIDIDVKLLDQLYQIQSYFGHDKVIMMVCGYRSPITNEKMRKANSGVADKSLHITGQAVDFFIDGVPLKMVQQAALAMKAGGVGYYPNSNFVHIDTGIVRYWPRNSVESEETTQQTALASKKQAAAVSPTLSKVSATKTAMKPSGAKRLTP